MLEQYLAIRGEIPDVKHAVLVQKAMQTGLFYVLKISAAPVTEILWGSAYNLNFEYVFL